MDNNEENKQGEEDIHLIVPHQPPKEEANYKESNPECKAESSDLSRPPGFEFMKKSSSSSSKCSTSFARFRKKDIKGVSLIHELNQIIDVGNSLGYDVRVVERGKEENACGSKIFALNTMCISRSPRNKNVLLRLFLAPKPCGVNFLVDYVCSMAQGHSWWSHLNGLDPNFFSKESIWIMSLSLPYGIDSKTHATS
ncbi:hypothetical protein Tco_1183395 [Tanacetum coccineum]